jgi:hypothetical protein
MLPQASRPVIVAAVGATAAGIVAVAALVAPSLASADTASPTPSASAEPTTSAAPSPAPTGSLPAPTSSPSTGPATVPQATLPLRKGAVGARVATAQQRLTWLGYSITATSQARQFYGDSTIKAVKAFQAKNWLPVTGKVDKKTWRTLERMAEPLGILPRRCTEKKQSICIDKTTRLLRYVVKGRVKMVADARFGAPGMETGEGLFSVHEKSFNHVSSRYHTWMPRAMFFNGDEAVHFSPDFTAVGYARGSHGCVGLRDMEKATWLFDQVPTGTRVYVYWS